MSIRDCGLMLNPQQGMGVEELVNWARYAEKAGYGQIARSDHITPTPGEGRWRRELDSPECWMTLSIIAASTSTIKFGPMVSPIGFRNPVLLAKMAVTLHSFSKGRLFLGLGGGWYRDEYVAYGYEFPKLETRIAQLKEGISIIGPLIRGERVDFDGNDFAAHTSFVPKPKGKLRLIMGGGSSTLLDLAAEHADELNVGFSPPPDRVGQVRRQLESKSPDREIKISCTTPVILGESRRDLLKCVRRYMDYMGINGDPEFELRRLRDTGFPGGAPEEFVSQLEESCAAGMDKFYFKVTDPRDKQLIELLTRTLKKL